jgi:hypothetical protein
MLTRLQLLVQSQEQHATLLKGLESTSALICRLSVIEDLYRLGAKLPSLNPERSASFQHEFEASLTTLCSLILEFQARALCYLGEHRVVQVLKDMFKQDGWDELLNAIEKSETSARSFTGLIDAEMMKRRFEEIRSTQERDSVWHKMSAQDEKVNRCLRMLYACPYRDRKERNSERVPGTCEWFTNHSRFQDWNKNQSSSLLWVSADPGCGKSVLAKYLIDQVLPSTSKRTTCYFFFKDDFSDQKSVANAVCAILRQLFLAKPRLLRDSILTEFETKGDTFVQSFLDLWSTLGSVAADQNAGEIVCILDALDECQDGDLSQLIQALKVLYSANSGKSNLKFLLTSRPYGHIRREFWELEKRLPSIRLSGENEIEVKKISKEIDLVIQSRVEYIGNKRSLEPYELTFLQEQLMAVPNRTYLWVHLTLDVIENISGFTKGNVRRALQRIPQNVDDAYNRILERSSDVKRARKLLHIVTAATRPLSVGEISLIMAIEETHKSYDDVKQELEPEERFQGTLRDLCGLFVVIIDTKIYLLHQTAKEFLVRDDPPASLKNPSHLTSQYGPLKWKQSLQPVESNRILAERCIWYLSSDFVRTSGRVLLDYSARNWAEHFREAGICSKEIIAALARNLCEVDSNKYTTWSDIYASNAHGFPKFGSSLIIASYFGLGAVVKSLLDSGKTDVNSKDSGGRSPLLWAAERGHEAVAKLLLDPGKADVNSKDSEGRTPLSWAAENGHEAAVKLLLDSSKADVNSKDSDSLIYPLNNRLEHSFA